MILRASTMRELDFSKLTILYREDIEKNRFERYPYMELYEGRNRAENDLYFYLNDIFFGESHGLFFVCVDHGMYVSALRLEGYNDGLLLNAIMTDSAFRRKGYASRVMEEALRNTKGPVYSHIHRKNKASIELHKKFGFVRLYDFSVLLDGTVSSDHITYIRKA